MNLFGTNNLKNYNVERFCFEGTIVYYSFTITFDAFTSLLQDMLLNKFWSVVY